jgi:hypothetical protein
MHIKVRENSNGDRAEDRNSENGVYGDEHETIFDCTCLTVFIPADG